LGSGIPTGEEREKKGAYSGAVSKAEGLAELAAD